MNLLIQEPPLQVLPSLAVRIGLNEALVLQQAHYWLNISSHIKDGHKWFYKTYDDWQGEFPFWSSATIRRTINNLEKQGYLKSSSKYNKMGIDKTKWYRIDYEKLVSSPSAQNEQSSCSKCTDEVLKMSNQTAQIEHTINQRIPTENKKNNVEKNLDLAFEVINYLNHKTGKNFKANSNTTLKLINGRVNDGYTFEDFKRVIDIKTSQWLKTEMNIYLRPNTLFSATNFENYLNENTSPRVEQASSPAQGIPRPIELNFEAGEDL